MLLRNHSTRHRFRLNSPLSTGASLLAVPLFALASLVPAAPASACGGFFCSSGPVDQQQETILFEVHDDGQVSATVKVSFNGDPGDFSWIIPVPEAPTVDVVPALTLDILDVVTRPVIMPPDVDYSKCENFVSDMAAASFGCSENIAAAPAEYYEPEASPEGEPDVTVTEIPSVGPYDDIVFVESSSDDGQAMVDWLNTNGYIVTAAMEPLINEYVAEGWGFLATKLAPDVGVRDIAPIKFTCPNAFPRLPLRLTAVAAQPDMRVSVHILGQERYSPMNYRGVAIERDDIRYNVATAENNYQDVVSWQIDRAGGAAFVTEDAGETQDVLNRLNGISASNADEREAQEYLNAIGANQPHHTRLFSRLSASDMQDDPIFGPSGGADVSNVISLRNRPAIEACNDDGDYILEDDTSNSACAFAYCGNNARCATTADGDEGCACAEGFVARQVLRTNVWGFTRRTVGCQAADEDLLGERLDEIGDPCDGFSCGDSGSCVAINGFPSCQCPVGMAAVVDDNVPGGIKCDEAVEEFDPTHLRPLTPPGGFPATADALPARSCDSTSNVPGALEIFAAVGLFWMLARRRKRHEHRA